jgi:GT2 family glycosyltransferase
LRVRRLLRFSPRSYCFIAIFSAVVPMFRPYMGLRLENWPKNINNKMMKKVASIVVNWQQPKLTEKTVESLKNQSYPNSIIVVDNGSKDNSFQYLEKELPRDVILIKSDINRGFGGGCNIGITKALELEADYIWLVNNDAVADKECLSLMIEKALCNSKIGIVGAKIIDPIGATDPHAGTVMKGINFSCKNSLCEQELNNFEYSWVTGACMLINTSALKKVGSFDTTFFMYWEDCDLNMRIRKAGYSIGISDKSIIHHSAGTSSRSIPIQRLEWHIESQKKWIQKHYSKTYWGYFLLYSRHIIKSLLDRDWQRLDMTLKKLFA